MPWTRIGVHNNSRVNLLRGLMERVYHVEGPGGDLIPPPRPARGAFDRLALFASAVVEGVGHTVPRTVAQVVAMYRGDRRHGMYFRASETLETEPLTRRDARVKCFVKAEKINMDKKIDPAPRVIQPRSPRFNLRIAQYLKHLEKKIFASIRLIYAKRFDCVGPIVCKGLSADRLASALHAKWSRFTKPVAIGLDASRFDQHVSTSALKWEHAVYAECYHGAHRKDLEWLLSMQLVNYGSARLSDCVVKYKNEGGRMSGDINTSLGNCLIMCGLIHQFAVERGITIDLANNGDDCVVFLEQRDLGTFSRDLGKWFLEFGFTMKVEEPVTTFERIEFCQTQPVCVDQQWTMCRSLVGLSKDMYSLLPWRDGTMAYGWASAIADSGLAIAAGMPMFEALYLRLQRLGMGIKLGNHPLKNVGGLYHLSVGMDKRPTGIKDSTRVSFWKAFGIPPYMQRLAEEMCTTNVVTLDTREVTRKKATHYRDTAVPTLRHFTP